MTTFQGIVSTYDGYDLDGDGIKEIELLKFLYGRNSSFDKPSEGVAAGKKLVLVLIESRLFGAISNSRYTADDLLRSMITLKQDLRREGREAKFLEMTTYHGPIRQDGKTLLAIREFFKSVRATFPNFEGALLVGSFPEASITRTWPQGPDEFPGQYRVGGPIGNFAGKRFEIVLADLDGNWREIYHLQVSMNSYVFKLTPTTTVSQVGTKVTLRNPQIETDTHTLQDTFWIQDVSCRVSGTTVEIDMKCCDPEVGAVDKIQPNPVARPDIYVSRINARSVAVSPPSPRLLDAAGKPQSTPVNPPISFGYEDWKPDPNMERTLLVEYLDRNHAFRSGRFSDQQFRISMVESGHLGTVAADQGLDGLNYPKDVFRDATLLAFTQWLKAPAIFRVISAHSDSMSTEMLQADDAQAALVEKECGGRPWRWVEENGMYVPSFKGHFTGDLMLYRTLWENGKFNVLPPSQLVHMGCDVNGVNHPDMTYNNPLYGTFQNAECLLFYANQVAVLSRASMWNEGPWGFGRAFGDSASTVMGEGWKGVSNRISQDPVLAQHTTQRKQNYIWGVIGDWTLQKYYPTWPFGCRVNTVDSTPEALSSCVYQDKIFIFWKANDAGNSIYYSNSTDGVKWQNGRKINSFDCTPKAVSACVFQNNLFLFWKANDRGNSIYCSSSINGFAWPDGRRINTVDCTPESLSSCVFQGSLYIFWKANDAGNSIYYSISTDGVKWRNGRKINSFDCTPKAVSACVFKNKLYLFWKANDRGNSIYYSYSSNGFAWPDGRKINAVDCTTEAPNVCVYQDQLFVFWKSNDAGNRIFCSGSSDGIIWPSGHKINDFDSTPRTPAACVFNAQLNLFWKSNDPRNWIFMSRNDAGHRI